MKRAFLLCLCLGASAALTACDIPAAVFDGGGGGKTTSSNGGSSSGTGGAGGTTTTTHSTTSDGGIGGSTGGSSTGGTGGTTTTTTTTTTTMSGPTVPCGWPEPVTECDPGQVCCFDKGSVGDFCSGPGTCDPPTMYSELKCNENADCTGGKVCCAFYALDPDQQYRVQKTYCASACDSGNQEIATCTDSSCDTGICTQLFGSAYPTYKFCISL